MDAPTRVIARSAHCYPSSADGPSSGDRPRTEFSAPTGAPALLHGTPEEAFSIRAVDGRSADERQPQCVDMVVAICGQLRTKASCYSRCAAPVRVAISAVL